MYKISLPSPNAVMTIRSVKIPAVCNGKNVYVVKFISRKTKANILTAKRTLNNRDFKFRGNDVFFNEHLSPTNRSLFATANDKKRTLGYKHLWTRGGTILMRKDDESEVFTIACEQDFANIV